MVKSSLDAFFQPRSVAVVGASPGKGGFANLALWNLRNYDVSVPVTAIHPRHAEVDGFPCVPSISAMPERPDLVIIGVRRESVAGVLEECVRLQVPAVTIVAVGFAEQHDEEGLALQAELDRIHAGSQTRIIGPNTIGVGSFMYNVVSTATGNMPPSVPPGPVAIVSKSGGVATGMVNRGLGIGLGFSFTVSIGNEMDVTFGEVLEYVAGRDEVKIVLCYMESIRDLAALRKAIAFCNAQGKPVIFLKSGTTEAGSIAAASHTGKLTGDGAVWRGLANQFGVVTAHSMDHALTTARIFVKHGRAFGKGVGGMGQGGGMTVMLADMFSRGGLAVPQPSPETQAEMRAVLKTVAPNNPFDTGGVYLGGDGTELPRALQALASEPEIGTMVILAIPTHRQRTDVIISAFIDATRELPKPVVILSYDERHSRAHEMMQGAGLLVIDQPDIGIQALKSWLEHDGGRDVGGDCKTVEPGPTQAVEARRRFQQAGSTGRAVLEDDGKALLALYGVRCPAEEVVGSTAEARAAAARMGGAVAVKLLSQQALHRGIGRGVILGVTSPDEVSQAFASVASIAGPEDRILVQQMAEPGAEFLIGALRDPELGLVMALGLGGARAEWMKDTMFVSPPVSRSELERMVGRWEALKQLRQGGEDVDVDALIDTGMAVSRFLQDCGEAVEEMDVNPVIVGAPGRGAVAVDALILPRRN